MKRFVYKGMGGSVGSHLNDYLPQKDAGIIQFPEWKEKTAGTIDNRDQLVPGT